MEKNKTTTTRLKIDPHKVQGSRRRRRRRCMNTIEFHSNEIGDVHGHLVDLRGIVLFDISQDANVIVLDEV